MKEKQVRLVLETGLHARPASLVVKIATKYCNNDVKLIVYGNKIVDAKSIMLMLSCAIENNQEFKIRVIGDNAELVLDEIIKKLEEETILVAI